MDTWYYSDGTVQLGPTSLKQLKSMFQARKLNGATLVFGPNLKDWVPASQVPDLFPQSAVLPSGENKQGSVADNFHNNGLAHAKRMEYDQAVVAYDKAIHLNPNDPVMYKNRGSSHLALENYDEAFADFNKAIELNPDYAIAYINRGYYHLTLENYDEAITDCDKAIELNPDKAEAYFNRGNAYEGQKDYDAAIADYNTAIELNPDFEEAITCRDNLLAKRKARKKRKAKAASEKYDHSFYQSEDSYMNNSNSSNNKYPMLDLLSLLYTSSGYLVLVLSVISSFLIIVFQQEGPKIITAIILLFTGFLSFIAITAVGQLIKLFIDIESNLRKIHGRLK